MREILESALPATPATVGVEASARSTSPLVRFVRRRPRTFEDEQHVDRLALPFHLCCVAKLAFSQNHRPLRDRIHTGAEIVGVRAPFSKLDHLRPAHELQDSSSHCYTPLCTSRDDCSRLW